MGILFDTLFENRQFTKKAQQILFALDKQSDGYTYHLEDRHIGQYICSLLYDPGQ